MSVDHLIRAALDVGVSLELIDGKVVVKAKGRGDIVRPMLERLRQHKAAIEQHLRAQADDHKPTPPEIIAQAAQVIQRAKQPHHHVDAAWLEVSKLYYMHHVNCQQCQGASQGRGHRCAPGLDLWQAYQAAENTIN